MAKIHRSKEVYKCTTTPDGVKEIRPVRGLYVSGTHLEPMYIDHNIKIQSFTSSEPTIVDYTERSVNLPTIHLINFAGMDTEPMDVVNYHTQESTQRMHLVNFVGMDTEPMQIVEYGNKVVSLDPIHLINFAGMDTEPMDVVWYSTNPYSSAPEHMLTIQSFESSDCTISDII